ncbi:MAG: 2-C-methyl-D-erythritol 4-phosphate cytidylyltransferase [Bacteroidia bacterium]|nr:2-C-methyl-D-erythritol 4-phosphate cytidylyltransferase [Bacteroidia bacterium]
MTRYALIVAGGQGLRMGGDLPKQFLLLGDKPVLMHTLEAFCRYDATMRLVLVLPREQQMYWADLCRTHAFEVPHTVVDGGETRFQSVKNGLGVIDGPGVVGVHDGVRPFVSEEVIGRCYELALTQKAVVPVVDIFDTIRCVDGEQSATVDRSLYKIVQTPQVFDVDLLKRAYSQDYTPFFTDDASVVEALGVSVVLVPGNRENIKLTTPFDLKVGNALMS